MRMKEPIIRQSVLCDIQIGVKEKNIIITIVVKIEYIYWKTCTTLIGGEKNRVPVLREALLSKRDRQNG